jgi:hypothetical protein
LVHEKQRLGCHNEKDWHQLEQKGKGSQLLHHVKNIPPEFPMSSKFIPHICLISSGICQEGIENESGSPGWKKIPDSFLKQKYVQ